MLRGSDTKWKVWKCFVASEAPQVCLSSRSTNYHCGAWGCQSQLPSRGRGILTNVLSYRRAEACHHEPDSHMPAAGLGQCCPTCGPWTQKAPSPEVFKAKLDGALDEQPDLMISSPAHDRGLELDDLWGFFQPKPFCGHLPANGISSLSICLASGYCIGAPVSLNI